MSCNLKLQAFHGWILIVAEATMLISAEHLRLSLRAMAPMTPRPSTPQCTTVCPAAACSKDRPEVLAWSSPSCRRSVGDEFANPNRRMLVGVTADLHPVWMSGGVTTPT